MPNPVDILLNRPLMTLTLVFTGVRGSSVLLSSMFAPLPRADQWSGLMPLPMKRTAMHLAMSTAFQRPPRRRTAVSQTLRDSSHGNAIVTPAP